MRLRDLGGFIFQCSDSFMDQFPGRSSVLGSGAIRGRGAGYATVVWGKID